MGTLTDLQEIFLPGNEEFEVPFDFGNCKQLTALHHVKGDNFKGVSPSLT